MYCAEYDYYYDAEGNYYEECSYYAYYYYDEYECLEECCGEVAVGHEEMDAELFQECV